ncbi:MAG: hypothetical protein FRX49_12696 [Trebouxia sp. A1-2]|nr:MAG: hypothetical protein FRX49_12696 [Trebouxia sp. A1-2]
MKSEALPFKRVHGQEAVDEHSSLKGQLAGLKLQLSAANSQAQLQQAEHDVKHVQPKLQQAETEILTLKRKLNTQQKLHEQGQRELQQKLADTVSQQLSSNPAEVLAECDQLKQQLTVVTSQNQESLVSIASLKTKLDQAEAAAARAAARVSAEVARVTEVTARAAESSARVDALVLSEASLRVLLGEAEERMSFLVSQHAQDDLAQQGEVHRAQNAAQQAQLQALQSQKQEVCLNQRVRQHPRAGKASGLIGSLCTAIPSRAAAADSQDKAAFLTVILVTGSFFLYTVISGCSGLVGRPHSAMPSSTSAEGRELQQLNDRMGEVERLHSIVASDAAAMKAMGVLVEAKALKLDVHGTRPSSASASLTQTIRLQQQVRELQLRLQNAQVKQALTATKNKDVDWVAPLWGGQQKAKLLMPIEDRLANDVLSEPGGMQAAHTQHQSDQLSNQGLNERSGYDPGTVSEANFSYDDTESTQQSKDFLGRRKCDIRQSLDIDFNTNEPVAVTRRSKDYGERTRQSDAGKCAKRAR